MMVGTTRGSFRTVTLDVDFDPQHPELGHVAAVIDAASIDTGSEQRDTHLRSPDFLDIAQFPTIGFTSTSVETRGYQEFGLHGDLTIHGVTKAIVLDVAFRGAAANPSGGQTAGFSAHGRVTTAVDRRLTRVMISLPETGARRSRDRRRARRGPHRGWRSRCSGG